MDLQTIISISTTSLLVILTISSAIVAWVKYFTEASTGTNTTQYNIASGMTFFSLAFISYILDDAFGVFVNIRPYVIGIFMIYGLMFALRFATSLSLKYKRWYIKNPLKKMTTAKVNAHMSITNALTPFVVSILIIISLFYNAYQTEYSFLPLVYAGFIGFIFYKIPFIGIYIPTKISLILMFAGSILTVINYNILDTPNILLYIYQQVSSISIIGSFSVLVFNMYIGKKEDPLK